MARPKQTARKSTGGKAPRCLSKQTARKITGGNAPRCFSTSAQQNKRRRVMDTGNGNGNGAPLIGNGNGGGDLVLCCQRWSSLLAEAVTELGRSEELLDSVTVSVCGREFRVAPILLCGFSPPLKAMITRSWRESELRRLELDLSLAAWKGLLSYLHSGTVTVTGDDVMETLHAACVYDVRGFKELLLSCLVAHMTPAGCLAALSFGSAHSLPALVERCNGFIEANASEVLESDEFAQSDEGIAKAVIEMPGLRLAGSEAEVFDALLRWHAHHDSVAAGPSASGGGASDAALTRLLKSVRFTLFTPEELRTKVDGAPVMQQLANSLILFAAYRQIATGELPFYPSCRVIC